MALPQYTDSNASFESPRCTPNVIWDSNEPVLGLEMLANPLKARIANEVSKITSPR
jgi:hypothetical protein